MKWKESLKGGRLFVNNQNYAHLMDSIWLQLTVFTCLRVKIGLTENNNNNNNTSHECMHISYNGVQLEIQKQYFSMN